MFHMDLGLGRVRAVLEFLGLTRPEGASVQVLGTNGKGSTSVFLAAILRACGVRVGLYASPHLVSPKERILVDGRELPDGLWLEAAQAVLLAQEALESGVSSAQRLRGAGRLTYFELLTVMAAWMFRRIGCGAMVFEAGLGGANDATSALEHHLAVYTPVGLDHAAVIGPGLADIARDKARAMRRGVPAVSALQEPDVFRVLAEEARRIGAPLWRLPEPGEGGGLVAVAGTSDTGESPVLSGLEQERIPAPSLAGPHQRRNLRLAWAAALMLHGLGSPPTGPSPFRATRAGTALDEPFPENPPLSGVALAETTLDEAALAEAARRAFVPGRLQLIPAHVEPPGFILDGAHNQPGLECLKQALESLGLTPGAMIFSCLEDKDLEAMLPLARALTSGPMFVPPLAARGRAADPALLATRLGGQARAAETVAQALEWARGAPGPVLVCGSLYLLGDVYRLMPGWLSAGRPTG